MTIIVSEKHPEGAQLHTLSASELLGMMERGETTSSAVLEAFIARMEQVNPKINAVIWTDLARARAEAAKLDRERAEGRIRGPLHGLPMTVKEVFTMVGSPSTGGLRTFQDFRPEQDSDSVSALRAAGAVIWGKTNIPEGVADAQSYNDLYGRTNNPWNLDRSAGGSSGGSAAALAAGITPLELGSDVGGSIRCPAHFCGVYGHKSSYGIVPAAGHVPPPPGVLRDMDMSVVGPLARDPRDMELAMEVLVRPGELDRAAYAINLPPARQNSLADFRVAVWLEDDGIPTDQGSIDAIEAVIAELERAGTSISRCRPAFDSRETEETYFSMLFGQTSVNTTEAMFERYHGAIADGTELSAAYAARIEKATGQSLRSWLETLEKREQLRRVWHGFFRDHDVLICPVTPTVAFPHDTGGVDHVAQLHRSLEVNGTRQPYLDVLKWVGQISLPNLPSTVVPTRGCSGGMPVGMQVVGDYLQDRTTLRFASLLHAHLGPLPLAEPS